MSFRDCHAAVAASTAPTGSSGSIPSPQVCSLPYLSFGLKRSLDFLSSLFLFLQLKSSGDDSGDDVPLHAHLILHCLSGFLGFVQLIRPLSLLIPD